jgi:hypothetical protein
LPPDTTGLPAGTVATRLSSAMRLAIIAKMEIAKEKRPAEAGR